MRDRSFGGGTGREADDLARFVDSLDGLDKAITPTRQSLDEAWLIGGVAQRLSQFADGYIEALFEIDKGFVGPQPFVKRFAEEYLIKVI